MPANIPILDFQTKFDMLLQEIKYTADEKLDELQQHITTTLDAGIGKPKFDKGKIDKAKKQIDKSIKAVKADTEKAIQAAEKCNNAEMSSDKILNRIVESIKQLTEKTQSSIEKAKKDIKKVLSESVSETTLNKLSQDLDTCLGAIQDKLMATGKFV